jgi:tRNA-dihydrouridine synthase
MRKHLLWYLKGYSRASEIKNYICTEKDMDKVLRKIKEFLENYTNN